MSTERKGLQPEEGDRSHGVCPSVGTGLLRRGGMPEGTEGEAGLGGGESLMTQPSDVQAIPTWSLGWRQG